MLPNDEDLQDSIAQGHGLPDYAKPDQPNVSAGQGGFEELLVAPDLYSGLKPPARGIFAKWLKALTRPSVATFASEIPAANWGITILGVLIFAVFYFLLIISGLIRREDTLAGIFLRAQPIETIAIYGFITNMIGLLLGAVVMYMIAVANSNGRGAIATHTYLYSLYAIPLAIIAHLLALIPGFGKWADGYGPLLAPVIYGLFLSYYMVRAAYRLNPGSARLVIFLIFLSPVFVFICFFIFLICTIRFA